jgi:hypothetical protein
MIGSGIVPLIVFEILFNELSGPSPLLQYFLQRIVIVLVSFENSPKAFVVLARICQNDG